MNTSALNFKKAPRARILVIENQPIVRYGITRYINEQPDKVVCAEANENAEALQLASTEQPDAVILDLSLGFSDGLELIKNLSALNANSSILVLSIHDPKVYAERVLQAGALGFVGTNESLAVIGWALRSVIAKKIFLNPETSIHLLAARMRKPKSALRKASSPEAILSNRELAVFSQIGSWKSTAEIAANLKLSIKTVEYYKGRIKKKLGLKDAAELARCATTSNLGSH